MEILEDGRLHQLCVERRDAVDPVCHDKGELAHPDLAAPDRRDGAARIGLCVSPVDLFDKLHMAWQEPPHKIFGPALECLRQERVVGVVENTLRRLNCVLERKSLLIKEESHQFRTGNGGMGVVELDRHFRGQPLQIVVLAFITAHDVADRCGGEEVLLLEPKRLAIGRGIVGIEHPADRAREGFRFGCPRVEALVETVEVEDSHGLGLPETQCVRPAPLPTDHRRVVRLGSNRFRRAPNSPAPLNVHMSAKSDLKARLWSREFPREGEPEPILRVLDLPTVLKALPEQPVFVTDAIAHGGTAQSGERFHEAGRKPPETTITKRGIGFGVHDLRQIQAKFVQRGFGFLEDAKIDHGVFQKAPDQKLHRKVVDPLLTALIGRPCRGEPALHNAVSNSMTQREPPVLARGMAGILAQRKLEVFKCVVPKGRNRHRTIHVATLRWFCRMPWILQAVWLEDLSSPQTG